MTNSCPRWAFRVALVATVSSFCVSCSEPDVSALRVLEYDEGFVRFFDPTPGASKEHELKGEMVVKLYDDYVIVLLDDDEAEYVIPRERVAFVGPK